MERRSTGRGTATVFGSLILLAGVVGAAVLFYMSQRRPERAIDEFARAPVGCTTTLEFTDTGMFFVFEETGSGPAAPLGDCEPVADPGRSFEYVLSFESNPVEQQRDLGISYDTGGRAGQSLASFVVDEPGRYEIEVSGDDLAVVAAIGRDPDDGVAELRRAAVIVGAIGVVLGGLLLLLARRRSKQAAAEAMPPDADGVPVPDVPPTDWGQPPVAHVPVSDPVAAPASQPAPAWPPAPPPVPVAPAGDAPPPPPPRSGSPAPSVDASAPHPWAPPSAGHRVEHASPPRQGSTNGDDE